jgi:hypothetical protein
LLFILRGSFLLRRALRAFAEFVDEGEPQDGSDRLLPYRSGGRGRCARGGAVFVRRLHDHRAAREAVIEPADPLRLAASGLRSCIVVQPSLRVSARIMIIFIYNDIFHIEASYIRKYSDTLLFAARSAFSAMDNLACAVGFPSYSG